MNNKLLLIVLIFFLFSCKKENTETNIETQKVKVKVVGLDYGYIPDYIELTGKTVYLNKSNLVAPISGYVTKVNAQQGDIVRKGQILFEMKTSEAYFMQQNDSLPHTDYGTVKIYSPSTGRIMNINVVNNNVFVDKGSVLCILISSNDLKIQVNVPFEYSKWTKLGNKCKIILPDNTGIQGVFTKYLPQVNEISQTVKILANIKTKQFLPENMIVKVLVDKSKKHKMQILPQSCLQTDALMTKFWVMKLINDSTAVEIPIKVGNQNHEKFEILSPTFNSNDKFVSLGSYGLNDTVLVKIIN